MGERPARGAARAKCDMTRSAGIPDDFYENIKPRLWRRIGRELRLAHRVLDLGCGGCELDRYLALTYRQRVTGVDISDGSFPGREASRTGRGRIQCIKANAARLDFLSDGTMDAVISMWALHEMEDPHAALGEARRVLRPGGKILIVDFPRGSLAQRLWNENYYSISETHRMLRHVGFEEVSVRTIERGQVIWATGHRPPRREREP